MSKPHRRPDPPAQGRPSRGETRAVDEGGRPEPGVDLAAATARTIEAVQVVAAPVLAAHHCELVQLEYRREPHGWVLRLYVERLGHDPRLAVGGVDLAACSRISRDLSTALDVEGTIEHAYHLEISSPGLERPLGALEHYRRFSGLPAKLVLREPHVPAGGGKGQRVLVGELLGAEGEGARALVRIADAQLGPTAVAFGDIARAHLVFVPKTGEKPGKGKGRPGARTTGRAKAEAGSLDQPPKGERSRATTNPREPADRQWHDVENER
jgi:ribosome maturation factor RimP